MVDKEFFLMSYFKVYSVSLLLLNWKLWSVETLNISRSNYLQWDLAAQTATVMVYFARRIQCKTLHKNASSRVSVQYQKVSFCEPWEDDDCALQYFGFWQALGIKGKMFAKKRYAEKAIMKKTYFSNQQIVLSPFFFSSAIMLDFLMCLEMTIRYFQHHWFWNC